MAQCYHRKLAWLTEDGLSFRKVRGARCVTVPCGKCLACRVNNAAQWATRAMHESLYIDEGCFITLTYNPENIPEGYNLKPTDVQKFLKRLRITLERKNLGHIRAFFLCGEYGTKKGRPHYHLLLLGWKPKDLKFFGLSYSGMPIYTSSFIEKIWGKGFAPIGTITSGSAAYVARYQKKATADNAGCRVKPFFRSSRDIPLSNGKKGALGAQWVIDNHASLRLGYVVHPSDCNIKVRIPEYYFDLLQKWYPDEYEQVKQLRLDFAMDSNAGFYIVDGVDHTPSVCAMHGEEFDYNVIADFLGEDITKIVNLSQSDLLALLLAKIKTQADEQERRLNKLKRNLHK